MDQKLVHFKISDSPRQPCAHETIQTHALFCRLDDQCTVSLRRYPNHEAATVGALGEGLRRRFSGLPHICEHSLHQILNSRQGLARSRGQPTQRRELGAQPQVLPVFGRPGDAIRVVITHFCSPACRSPRRPDGPDMPWPCLCRPVRSLSDHPAMECDTPGGSSLSGAALRSTRRTACTSPRNGFPSDFDDIPRGLRPLFSLKQ